MGLGITVGNFSNLIERFAMSATLELNAVNVETVLDELRPYLMADGGNVELVELEGPVVKLRLQGACGSCPSSAMTLKMGIERKLRETIPEISEVEQVL
jgi:Fe-S cluster biogenesis protein NfuA